MELQRDVIALILYFLVLIIGLIRSKQKKMDYFLKWTGLFLLLYFLMLDIQSRTVYLLIPIFFFFLFYFFYSRDKCRLSNGWLLNLFFVSFVFYLGMTMLSANSWINGGILAVLFGVFLLILIFGVYAAIIFLIGNSFIVLRHESRRLPNLLTLLLGLAIIGLVLIQTYGGQLLPSWAIGLLSIPTLIAFYFFIVFWNFLSISLVYQLNRPKYDQDYVIVLGAGLIDGRKVTPLLARRIDRAIAFYHKQSEETLSPPILLMSGGQGGDEKVPEAQAMMEYALEQGIPEEDILMEAHSTTTYENMKFSKEIMERRNPDGYHAIFSSNNYHIFRAGMFASAVGLKADGIGAKTARYYLPNAFLREFIAVALMKKRVHFIICLLICLGVGALAAINFYFGG